jgi:tetratricopeptide (TPR) repeat protein
VLHAKGVLHRDLKPENVLLVSEGRLVAKLMDFGLAREAARALGERTSTGPGAGTTEYMSPEQIAGRDVGLTTDVYALGVMLYELATLRLPFYGDRHELEYAHLSFRPPRPSRFADVPQALEEVILRAIAKDPARRFSDAEALRVAFGEAMAVTPESGRVRSSSVSPSGAPPAATRSTERAIPLRASDRQRVALLFADSPRLDAIAVQAAVEPFGGQLAHAEQGRCACAFTYRAGDNPGQRALSAAEALLAKELVVRVVLDVGTASVKPRPSGAPRLLGPVFTDENRYPRPSDPAGILLTGPARTMLPAVACEPSPSRPDHFVLATAVDDTDRTITRTVAQDASAPLVGRNEALRELAGDARLAVAEQRPRVASVLADAGIGKTRFAFELAHLIRAAVPAAKVIELRAREPLGNNPDDTLAELLRRTLDLPSNRPPDGGREILIDRLGELGKDTYAGAALVLGWITHDHPAVQALRAAPGVLRANAAKAAMESLRRLGAQRPVAVIVDDAHWATDTLLDALEQATVYGLPLWICAVARPVFAETRPAWGQRAAHTRVDHLGPLDAASARELCRQLLRPATNVPEPVLARLVDLAQGVPILVCDLVSGLRREGLVQKRVADAWYIATEVLDRIPDLPLAEWIAGRELDELPSELAAHARLSSLLSPEFATEELEGVVSAMDPELGDAFPLDAAVATERLHQARLLVRHHGGKFSFRNAVTRDAVAKTVAELLGLRIHRAALGYYRSSALPDATRLPRLAWHASRAGERKECASTYLVLAERARERHDYLEADLLYSRALADQGDVEPEARQRALKGRGIVRYRLARHDDSLADLALARQLAVESGDAIAQADVMLDESMALDWLLEWHRSRELAEGARKILKDGAPPVLEARLTLALGRSYHRFNQDREAAELLREAARLAEAIGDDAYEVRVTANMLLGFLLPFLGLLDEAEERLDRTSALCTEKGDELHLAGIWNNRSCLWIARNDRERFMQDNERVLEFARRMGNAHLERGALFNSAYFLYWRGECDAAAPFARRAWEIDERQFWQGGYRPDAPVLLARILWGVGDDAGAKKLAADVKDQQTAYRAEGKSDLLLPPNDEVLLDMTLLVLSGGTSAAWDALLARARDVAQGQEIIEVLEMAGIAALGRGDLEGAKRWWGEALDLGERIPNVMAGRIRLRLADLE